jgi:hypothetical protein
MIYVDMPYLKYLHMPKDAHFGGHSIVVFGLDEEEGIVYVSDRDGKDHEITISDEEVPTDSHKVSLQELEQARGSKCKAMPPKNKWLTFDFTHIKPLDESVIMTAIGETTEKMLYPPIKNLGLKGIRTCAQKVLGWKVFDDEKLKWSAFNGFIFINQIGGTGGGGFRKMYGNFLRESGTLINSEELTGLGNEYFTIGEEWDKVADKFHHIYKTLDRETLKPISEYIRNLGEKETNLMNRLKEFSES